MIICFEWVKVFFDVYVVMFGLEKVLVKVGLECLLIELVYLCIL